MRLDSWPSIRQYGARLEQALAAQSRFIADAAHELRTLLSAISGVVEVVLRGLQDDPAAANRLLVGLHRKITRLLQLAEQLLDMALNQCA